jgi:uncharacterized repeat protein (TIGR02059 family)
MPIGRPKHELIKALTDSGMHVSHAYAVAKELTEFANEQALAVEVPFTAEVPLDVRETLMAQHFVDDAIEFTAGAVRLTGAKTFVRVVADGTNAPTFDGIYKMAGSGDYLNTDKVVNLFTFFHDGATVWYSVTNNASVLADITPPSLLTATVEDADPADIVLTFDEDLDETSVPAAGDFTLSVGEVESVDVTDDVVTLTVDAPYADDDVVTVTYTPGANPLRDLFGNNAAALASEAVTNNVLE